MKATKTVDVDPSVAELAELFACLPSDKQAEFFRLVRDYAENHFEKGRFAAQMQWHYMSQDATPVQREAIMEVSASAWLHASEYLKTCPRGDW